MAIVAGAMWLAVSSCQTTPRFNYDFEQETVLDQFDWECRTLYRLSPEHATSGAKSLEMLLYPAPAADLENYPGVSFTRFDPDWSGNRALVFDAYNPETTPLRLGVRIDDRDSPDYAERFNNSFVLAPGDNRVSISFTDLVTSGSKRRLDQRRIRAVMLFLANPKERHSIYLDRVRLE